MVFFISVCSFINVATPLGIQRGKEARLLFVVFIVVVVLEIEEEPAQLQMFCLSMNPKMV